MRRSLSFVGMLAVVACSDSNDAGNPAPVATNVFAIQSGDLASGQRVAVTAYIMAIAAAGDRLWISDGIAAGPRTGVEVYRGGGAPAPTFAVGDRIEVEGTLREFGQGAGLTVTQIADPDITVITPAAAAPIPQAGLDPAVITLDPIAGVSANGEVYEGVLIQLTNLEITSTAPYTLSDGTTAFPAGQQVVTLSDPVGTCYASVTGIWNYDVASDDWLIVPTAGGLVSGGTCS